MYSGPQPVQVPRYPHISGRFSNHLSLSPAPRLGNDLLCVEWDIKPYNSLIHSA